MNEIRQNGLLAVEQALDEAQQVRWEDAPAFAPLDEAQQVLLPETYGPPSTPTRIQITSNLVGKAVQEAVNRTADELRKLIAEAEQDLAHAKSEIEALIADVDRVVADHTGLVASLLSNVKSIAETTATHRKAMLPPTPKDEHGGE